MPGIRTTSVSRTLAMKSSIPMSRRADWWRMVRRPPFHVIMMPSSTAPTAIENQPPLGIFGTLAPKNARSTVSITAANTTTAGSGHVKRRRAMTVKRTVVMAIVAVTAMP